MLCQPPLVHLLQKLSRNFPARTIAGMLRMPLHLLIGRGIFRHLVLGVPFFVDLGHARFRIAQGSPALADFARSGMRLLYHRTSLRAYLSEAEGFVSGTSSKHALSELERVRNCATKESRL